MGTGGKKRREKKRKEKAVRNKKIGLNSWTLFCCSVTDLQPHLLLCHTIETKAAQNHTVVWGEHVS